MANTSRSGVDATVREGTRRAAARHHSSHITPTTAALLQQTRTVPIVFATVSDPVGSGFVASFPQPGGNVTGFTSIDPSMPTKWLQLLKEIAPRVVRVAVLFNPATAPYARFFVDPLKTAAPSVGMEAAAVPRSQHLRNEIDRCQRGHCAKRQPFSRYRIPSWTFIARKLHR